MMRRRTLLAAVAAAAGLVSGARAGWAGDRRVQGLLIHPTPRPVPPLPLLGAEGETSLAAWSGRPLLLNLWASWCLPCVAELPALDRLHARAAAASPAVIALSLNRRGLDSVRATFDRLGIHRLDAFVSPSGKAGEILGAPVLPTTLLIDRAGREVARYVGAAEWDGDDAGALLQALAQDRAIGPEMAPAVAKMPATAP